MGKTSLLSLITEYHATLSWWHDWLTTRRTTNLDNILTTLGLEKYYDKSALGRTTVLLQIWRRFCENWTWSDHLSTSWSSTWWLSGGRVVIWESGWNLQRNGSKTRKTVFLWKKPEIIRNSAPVWAKKRICLPYIYLNSTLATVLAALSATWWS